MTQDNSAKSIWDKRYQEGELACAKQTVEADPVDYTQHPFLYKLATAKRITGDLDGNPLIDIARRFLVPPAKKMLAVGSGLAFAEEALVRAGLVENVVAFEASDIAVASARDRFSKLGLSHRIEMRCGDVIAADLQDQEFDLVFVQAAIHHFYNIEEMFSLFYRVLKPGGLIIYDEYIGPDHHLYEDEVMETLDEINECLDVRYRFDSMRQAVREEVPKATLDWMLQMDPSEGVHASMILPLTYKYFDVIHRVDYGGTVMRPFFVGILPNFDFSDAKDQTVASLIIKMEEMLIRHGILPSYHTKVVGRKLEIPREKFLQQDGRRINYSNWSGFETYGALSQVPPVAEFSPSDHSDANWSCGIGVFGEPTLFLSATRRALQALIPGRIIRFRDMSVREIDTVQENAGSLILKFVGKALDPSIAGYPHLFRVVNS